MLNKNVSYGNTLEKRKRQDTRIVAITRKKYVEQIGENSMVNMPADAWVERVKMVVILTH